MEETRRLTNDGGYFDVIVALSMILGFAEDYRKIIANAKHELIFTRSRSELNAIIQDQEEEQFRITIHKVEWIIPYVMASDQHKI